MSMIDKNQAARIRTKREGITYYALERHVNELITNWNRLLKENPSFGEEQAIDMQEIVTTWNHMFVELDDYSPKKGNKRTRIGLITAAMRMLETEGLIVVLDKDDIPKAVPKTELFERIEFLYHDYDRYEQMKELMRTEEKEHAEDPSH